MSGWNPSGPQQPSQPPQPSGPQQPDPAYYPPQQGYSPQPQGDPAQQAYPPYPPQPPQPASPSAPSAPSAPYGPTPPYPPELLQRQTVPSQYHPPSGPQPGASGAQAGYPQPYGQPSAPQGYPQEPNYSRPLGQPGLSGAQFGQAPYTPTQGYPQAPYGAPSTLPGYPPTYTQQAYPAAPSTPGYGAPMSPPYGSPPPQPPTRRAGRIAVIAGAVVAALVIAGLIGGLVLARGGAGGKPSVHATATTAPTATPSPLGTATLGGTLAAFTSKYGAPISSSATSGIYQVTIAGQNVNVLMTLQIGLDQTPHIAAIILAPPSTTSSGWDEATTMTLITDLVPADAQLDQSQSNNTFGITRVFVSPSLAHTFTPSLFTNLTTNATVPPGTLTAICLPSSANSANFSACTFDLGLG